MNETDELLPVFRTCIILTCYILKNVFEGTSIWAPILLEQLQNRSRFEIEDDIPFTIRELHSNNYEHVLTFIRVKKLFSTALCLKFKNKVMR